MVLQEEALSLGCGPLPSRHLCVRPCIGVSYLSSLFQGSAPILVVMVILLNIGVAILFINFFI